MTDPRAPGGNLVIGVTGGIGSGKSTAARLFAEHGAGLVDTDAVALARRLDSSPDIS